jgi:WD40 repeat protein/uncharacterized caspase-like protein
MVRWAGAIPIIAAAGLVCAWPAHSQEQAAPAITVQAGHADNIDRAFYVKGERYVLTSSFGDRTSKLWDLDTGTMLRTFPVTGHDVAISPDGTKLAFAGGHVSIWNIATGAKLIDLPDPDPDLYDDSVAFSADGRTIYAGGAGGLKAWDADTGAAVPAGYTVGDVNEGGYLSDFFSVRDFSFSRDGRRLAAVGYDGEIEYRDVASGQILFSQPAGHFETGAMATVNADQRLVAIGDFNTRRIDLWSLKQKKILRTLTYSDESDGYLNDVVISPDGRYVLGVGTFAAVIWDSRTGRTVLSLNTGGVSGQFSSDSKRVLLGRGIDVLEFELESGNKLRAIAPPPLIKPTAVALAPDGSQVAVGIVDRAAVWDVTTGRPLFDLPRTNGPDEFVSALGYTPDGKLALVGDWYGGLAVADSKSGAKIGSLPGHSHGVISLSFSADSRWLLSADYGGQVILWDLSSREKISSRQVGQHDLRSAAISADGSVAVAAGEDAEYSSVVVAWDPHSGEEIVSTKPSRTVQVFFEGSSASDVLLVGGGLTIDRWNLDDGTKTRLRDDDVAAVGLRWAAPSGASDLVYYNVGKYLRSYDLEMQKDVFSGSVHGGEISGLSLSADGRVLASASDDGSMVIWDTGSGRNLTQTFLFKSDDGNGTDWVTITPEGFFDGTPGGMRKIKIVDGFDVYSIDQAYQALYRPDLVQAALAGDPDGAVSAAAGKLDLQKVIDSGLAPQVAITPPPEATDKDRIKVKATIRDLGGGIGKVEWKVNGLTVGVQTPKAKKSKNVAVERMLDLSPGGNRIEIIAYNADNLLASTPQAATVTSTAAAGAAKSRLFILAVGINDYWDSRLRLNYSVPDAQSIAAAFGDSAKTLYDGVEVATVADADATVEGLEAAFDRLAGEIRPDDVFLFFLAGHGITADGRYHFIPYEFRYRDENSLSAGAIDQDRLQDWFSRLPARRSLLLFDTCESGSLTGPGTTRGVERLVAVEKMTKATGRTILAASTDDAPALEGVQGHGVFSYVLLQALGEADANQDSLLQVTELAGYVDRRVPEVSFDAFGFRQVPQMNLVGSDFAVAKAGHGAVEADSTETESAVAERGATLVVIAPGRIFSEPDGNSQVVGEVAVGTQVGAVRRQSGWVLIKRDGRTLGYVTEKQLATLQ